MSLISLRHNRLMTQGNIVNSNPLFIYLKAQEYRRGSVILHSLPSLPCPLLLPCPILTLQPLVLPSPLEYQALPSPNLPSIPFSGPLSCRFTRHSFPLQRGFLPGVGKKRKKKPCNSGILFCELKRRGGWAKAKFPVNHTRLTRASLHCCMPQFCGQKGKLLDREVVQDGEVPLSNHQLIRSQVGRIRQFTCGVMFREKLIKILK